MCDKDCIDFGKKYLKEEDIRGKEVIEVGSIDINGSLRYAIEIFKPAKYIGVDIQKGHGVDQICDAQELIDRFGEEAFDLLVSTELLEHVRDWRKVISNFKNILRPNGVLLITTRSRGFPYHDCPFDYWRYDIHDINAIFSDFTIEAMEKGSLSQGVLVKARKPNNFNETDIKDYKLYSIIKGIETIDINNFDINLFKIKFPIKNFLSRVLPVNAKEYIKKLKNKNL